METGPSPTLALKWPVLTGTAFAVVLFLYFIDEGRYSLQGLLTAGNLFAMSIYFLGSILGLFLMSTWFAKRKPGTARTLAVLVLGTLLGIVLSVLSMFGLGLLVRL